jgi:predicted ATPase/DNA-binding SARP family transcriptional activator
MPPLNSERLPARLAPLVGRQSELRDVLAVLSRSRLLSLTGPGGTGKTRLALAAAGAAGESYSAGVCWVELAPLDDALIVAQEVASRVGVPDSPGQDAAAAITEHIADRQALIVLDNCEHLTSAVARLAERLLAGCPGLSILATSREVLGVDGERNWPVPPLSLPDAAGQLSAAAVGEYDAVKLFEQRAQLIRPSFAVTDENAADVLQVCRRLDGLPLAIELAAARMHMLSVSELASRLDDLFSVLVGGTRSAPPRHQALRATLDWSYDLLEDEEKAVFRRLSVFAGGFSLAAAEQVAAGEDIDSGRMLDLLVRLADKSLLQADLSGPAARYYLLGIVREYAAECLARSVDSDATRRAHLSWYVSFVQQIVPRIDRGDGGPHALELELDAVDAETANLRVALEFARQTGDTIAALQIAGPLGHYAYLRGHYHEVRQWMDAAVTGRGSEVPAGLRAQALLGSGRLALLQCDYLPAIRRLEAALRLYRDMDDQQGISATLQVLGSVAREQGRYARAMELHAESLSAAETVGDRWAIARAHSHLGFVLWLQREYEQATSECELALAISRELAAGEEIAWSQISLGAIARYQGESARSAALLADSRALAEQLGFREAIAWSLEQQGLLAIDQADPAAADLLRRSLEIHHELRDRWRTCSLLDDLAAVALANGQAAEAAALLGTADALRTAIGTVVPPCERALRDQTVAATSAALGEAVFGDAFRRGMQASVDDVRDSLARSGDPGWQAPAPSAPVPAQSAASPAQSAASQAHSPDVSGAAPGRDQAAPAELANEQGAGGQADGVPARKRGMTRDGRRRAGAGGQLTIRALGAASVHRGDTPVTAADWGYAKPRELLFLLATSRPLTRDQLGAALWPDLPPDRLGNTLHTALRGVRRALGDPDWVTYADGRYSFNAEREHECDVETFEQALAAARRARPAEAALPDLQRAIAAYGGEFLAGMAAGEWAETRRDELGRSFESALLAAGRLQAGAGRFAPAAAAFRRAVAHEPLNETAHRELMSCWARMGETARALRHYQELADLLRAQLGVAPGAETTALYRKLAGTVQPAPSESPRIRRSP